MFSECPGAAEYCVIAEHYLGKKLFEYLEPMVTYLISGSVPKPASLSHVDCAAGLDSGLRAYTTFHTQASIAPGNIVLITGGASVNYPNYYFGTRFKFIICHRLMVL